MVKKMKVTKYHSCENVFLIVDYNQEVDYSMLSFNLCNSLEADGLIAFKNDPVEMLFYNKDGSQAKMCGNGIGCLMHYLYDRFYIYKYLKIKVGDKYYDCQIDNINPFITTISLGIGDYINNLIMKQIVIDDQQFTVTAFDLGVNHLVVITTDIERDLIYLERIFNHELFNKEFNVDLVKILDDSTFEILTYERGVGITKGCGSGAAASAFVLHSLYLMNKNLTALNQGGLLKIDIEDEIYLTGESKFVCEYEYNL